MFKNLRIYSLGANGINIEALEGGLIAFTRAAASQEKSSGFVPPRHEDNGPLIESVNGQVILEYRIENRAVPADEIKRKADEIAAHIEQTAGRKPGKKEMRDIKEDAKLQLLPNAFSKFSSVKAWFDIEGGLLVLDASNQARADEVITALVAADTNFAPRMFNTNTTPQSAMASWLLDGEAQDEFQIEQECELKSTGEDRAVVKYNRHGLDIDEIKDHIRQGKLPTKLALNWQGRVVFTLTESMVLKKIDFLETVFDGVSKEDQSGFDADVTIATGELRQLLPNLIEVLGGELKEFGGEAG